MMIMIGYLYYYKLSPVECNFSICYTGITSCSIKAHVLQSRYFVISPVQDIKRTYLLFSAGLVHQISVNHFYCCLRSNNSPHNNIFPYHEQIVSFDVGIPTYIQLLMVLVSLLNSANSLVE